MSRLLAVVVLLAVSTSSHSATVFDITIDSNSRLRGLEKATVTIDGPKIRIDLEPVPGEVITSNRSVSTTGPAGFVSINATTRPGTTSKGHLHSL